MDTTKLNNSTPTPVLLTNTAELLFRQVHPTFIQENRPTSQAFKPTPKDEKKLSVSREQLTTASASYETYTNGHGLESVGVWGVTVGEATSHALPVQHAPLKAPPVDDPAHTLIDYTGQPREAKVKTIAQKLAASARDRGCLFKP